MAHLGLSSGMGGKKIAEKKEEGKERVLERERLHLLSKFPDNRTSAFKRSKRKSSTSWQDLCIEIGVGEF